MNILAALIFFTRLPFWKIREVPAECFKHVVPYWSLAGWLTAALLWYIMAGRATVAHIPCMDYSHHRQTAHHRMPPRGRVSRFLRWIWRRKHPRAYTYHHERFAHRKLRSHWPSILLSAVIATAQPASELPLHPRFLW